MKKKPNTAGAITSPQADAWNAALKGLLENEAMPYIKDDTDGTYVAQNFTTGQTLVVAILNNEETRDGVTLGARQGYLKCKSAEVDPYKLSPLPEPPPSGSPIEEWIRYYYTRKDKDLKIKWRKVAELSGFTEGQLKTTASRMRNSL